MSHITIIKLAATVLVIVVLGLFLWTYSYARDRISFEPAFIKYELDSLKYKALYARHSSGTNTRTQTAEASGPAQSVPVLVYHGVEAATVGGEYDISPEQFREQFFALKKAGYETISLDELYAFKTNGAPLPSKPIVITFDDGRADSYYGAGPILNAVGFESYMFAISRYAGPKKNDYYLDLTALRHMSKDPLWHIEAHARDAHDEGYQIGPDSFGPFYANLLWKPQEGRMESLGEYRGRITSDLAATKQELETRLDTKVRAFAFPFGEYGQNHTNDERTTPILLEESAKLYQMLFYQVAPGVHFTQTYPHDGRIDYDTYLIRRIAVGHELTTEGLLEFLRQGDAKTLPYRDNLAVDHGWRSAWGSVRVVSGQGLTLRATESQTGASTILDGTAHWTDYTVEATVETPPGSSIFLYVRHLTDNQTAACNFGNNFMHIEHTKNGVLRVVKGIKDTGPVPTGLVTVRAKVTGRTLECTLGDTTLSTTFLDPELDHGGIGWKTWDRTAGRAELQVHSLEVTPIEARE